jgi:hypothetical protein
MAGPANVLSIDAIKQFHDALANFIEEAKHALVATDMENRRTLDWIRNNQRMYWLEEVKRRREKVGEASTALHRKKLQQRPGSTVHDADEAEALRVAKMRLREAEEKIEIVKRWGTAFQHAVDEYQGSARPLADMLEHDAKRALALLERMAAALEEYIRLSPPSA